MAVRRQRRGYGSHLSKLEQDLIVEDWWPEIDSVLTGIPHAVVGGVAANAYMAPRFTDDLDIGVMLSDLARATSALRAAGWPDGRRVHLVPIPRRWGRAALDAARRDQRTGVVTLPLGYVVLMKLAVSRSIDIGDLTRLLGGRSDEELAQIREIVRRFGGPDDPEDLEQLIALGRLERDDRP
jgi:hypothetical protein